MKISVDIDEEALASIMKLTGETKKGPAIMKAAMEYARKSRLKAFGGMIRDGSLDGAIEEGYNPDRFEPLGHE